ncbi:squalene/phytoene synthase family protein [Streptomyces sp. NPDC097619]|uniref:squalene/phytoene synthase family protein n=1 Tax=Streptomyces sp. NPDC097619 TaxID=3157228 RepID=UPI003318BB69
MRWQPTLTTAGITAPTLRADYTAASRRVLRRERAPYLALRLLAEPRLVPYLTAGLAFMNLVDDTAEGPDPETALRALAARVDAALAEAAATGGEGGEGRDGIDDGDGGDGTGGTTPDAVLRAYAHAVATRGLPRTWIDRFLAGAAGAETTAGTSGFADEGEFQAYLDAYSWPGILVFTGLQYEGGPTPEQAAAWRRFVDAAQRVDFLADLAGDLADGRLCIPRARLDEHGVTRAALAVGADTPQVRALLAAECGRARTALAAAADVVDHADPGLRRVGRTMIDLMGHQLDLVEAAGTRAARRDTGYGLLAPLRILAAARRS